MEQVLLGIDTQAIAIITLISTLYMFFISLAVGTNNLIWFIIFKFVPFILGLSLLIFQAKFYGII